MNMTSRAAKFKQSEVQRLFKAAANARVSVRLEFQPDGTIVVITNGTAPSTAAEAHTDLDGWMKKHDADPT
jgi:diadenosine tetraphosphate (Ap4A) HIT family hydrolase